MIIFSDVSGQIAEDFGDGELHNNPCWIGDTGSFVVNYLKELQLVAAQEGEVFLSTGNVLIDSTEWLFRLRLGFSPSANNYARVYLVADTSALNGLVNGYYLQFGETGSLDAMTLFRQEGTVHTEVCRGESGAVAQAFDLRVRVIRSKDGVWDLFLRNEYEASYRHQASCTDAFITTTSHFGLVCKFTSSNKQNFWFDDIYVQPIYKDVVPPSLASLRILDDHTIILRADEPLLETSLETENYLLLPINLEPSVVNWGDGKQESLVLTFSVPFENPGNYLLWIWQWCDRDSNCSGPLQDSFLYVKARRWDVIISELMTDPDPPPFNLPPLEYVELFNRTPYPVPLGGWKLIIGNTSITLKEDTIAPESFKLLTPTPAEWGPDVVPQVVKNLSLPNTGAKVSLWDETGNPIASIEYSSDWYDDPFKKDGGWSLEILDPSAPCLDEENWKPSNHPAGGTPGRENSRNAIVDDQSPPRIEYAFLSNNNTLTMVFSERMNPATLTDTTSFRLVSSGKSPQFVSLLEPDCKEITLFFEDAFHPDSIYLLWIHPYLTDCSGNALLNDSLVFGFSYLPAPGDLVINEILFNPWPGGEDFVEIFNLGSRIIDLSSLRICSLDPTSGAVKSVQAITTKPYFILPGAYRVITPSRKSILMYYPNSTIASFLPDMSSFPSYPDDKGGVGIALYTGEMLDAVLYNKSMHNRFLKDVEGVSLERLNPHGASQISSNWHSASESVGFATPGYRNSHSLTPAAHVAEFHLEPKELSPNNDGWNDLLRITIRPENPGTKANAWILNAGGRIVQTLCRALTLASETTLIWDGSDQEKLPTPNGVYIFYAEVIDEGGRNKRHKEAFYLIRD